MSFKLVFIKFILHFSLFSFHSSQIKGKRQYEIELNFIFVNDLTCPLFANYEAAFPTRKACAISLKQTLFRKRTILT